jgi:hypothetical protein
MKPAHKHPDQIWRAYLIAQSKLEQHELAAPTRSIRELHKRVRVRVQIFRVKP